MNYKINLDNNSKNKKDKINIHNFFIPDLSLMLLIISNIITIFFAIKGNWNLNIVMLIYWCQSVIIGFFNFLRILTLKNFTTKNFKINNQSVDATNSVKYSTAFFFLFHYGFFHFVYLIFLSIGFFENSSLFTNAGFLLILLNIFLFFFNHLFSFIYNFESDSKKTKNIGTVMFFPYARIIPMHLCIVFGIFLSNNIIALTFFMILKTFADIIMHQIEHK